MPNLAVFSHALLKAHATFFLMAVLPAAVSVQMQIAQGRLTAMELALLFLAVYLGLFGIYFATCLVVAKLQLAFDARFRAEFEVSSDVDKGRMIGSRLFRI